MIAAALALAGCTGAPPAEEAPPPLPTPFGAAPTSRAIVATSGGRCLLGLSQRTDASACPGTGTVWRAAAGGAAWEPVLSVDDGSPRSWDFQGDRGILYVQVACGGASTPSVYVTHDQGASWRHLPLPEAIVPAEELVVLLGGVRVTEDGVCVQAEGGQWFCGEAGSLAAASPPPAAAASAAGCSLSETPARFVVQGVGGEAVAAIPRQ